MLKISDKIEIPDNEIEISATLAGGPGGQHVNKSATAAHLRFDINASSLPDEYKKRLLEINDQRVTKSGVIVIKASRYRSFEANREDAYQRLYLLLKWATAEIKKRKPGKPSKNSQKRRMDRKTRHGRTKALRKKVQPHD